MEDEIGLVQYVKSRKGRDLGPVTVLKKTQSMVDVGYLPSESKSFEFTKKEQDKPDDQTKSIQQIRRKS